MFVIGWFCVWFGVYVCSLYLIGLVFEFLVFVDCFGIFECLFMGLIRLCLNFGFVGFGGVLVVGLCFSFGFVVVVLLLICSFGCLGLIVLVAG